MTEEIHSQCIFCPTFKNGIAQFFLWASSLGEKPEHFTLMASSEAPRWSLIHAKGINALTKSHLGVSVCLSEKIKDAEEPQFVFGGRQL